jgi:ABC-2 type transport system ATP-binding protein
METVIETRDLSKSFGGKPAVDRLSLSVPKGAIFALLGDNGAGKTTAIRMLTGLLPADHGSATVLGQDCWKAASALRRRVAYVPERPRFYDWMTVAEIGWFTAGFHAKEFTALYRDRIDKFQLEPSQRLSNLSKGQYAKVGLALALAIDPEVLILDEPTSGLDLLVRREFLGSMVSLAAEGRTILLSSHQLAEVERVASHVAFIAHGRLLLAAGMDELKRRIVRVQLRYESQPPDAAALALGTVLQRNGSGKHWQAILQDPRAEALASLPHTEGVHEVEVSPLHLEDIYCALLAGKEEMA